MSLQNNVSIVFLFSLFFLFSLDYAPYEYFDSGIEALAASIAAVSKYGGASAGYRTLLDALIPALLVLQEVLTIAVHFLSLSVRLYFTVTYYALDMQKLNSCDDPSTAFLLSSEAALAGAESTKNMQAQVTTYY